jgi:hypothetical protein
VIIDLVLAEPLRLLANSIDAARILMRPRIMRLTPPLITHRYFPQLGRPDMVRTSDPITLQIRSGEWYALRVEIDERRNQL